MKKAYLIAILVIGIASGFTLWAFSNSMTPYVDIRTARTTEGMVQVRGKILHDKGDRFDALTKSLHFTLEDKNGEQIEVVYQGAKPEAFDTAPETAATGMIKKASDGREILVSNNLIVKCESKYEGKKTPYQKDQKAVVGR